MKANKIFYILLILGFMASGCSDQFLKDKQMYNNATEEIFTTETQTNQYLAYVYYEFFNPYTSPEGTLVGQYTQDMGYPYLTEERGGTISKLTDPNSSLSSAADCSAYIGAPLTSSIVESPYTRIRNCNYVYLNIDTYGSNLTQTFRNRIKGQVLVLRAMQYFDLVRMYGGVPLVTKVYDPSSSVEKLPRASVTECVEQILKDLNEAAGYLPAVWDDASNNYGRLTSAAALALESRVLLTYASPIYNKDWNNTSNNRWKLALKVTQKAVDSLSTAGYGLYGSSANDWENMLGSSSNTFNKEAIIIRLMSSSSASGTTHNGWENSIRLKAQGGSGGISAPLEMVDLFPMADGTDAKDSVKLANGSLKFFLNRDPRFYRTFGFSGCNWPTNAGNDTIWTYRWKYTSGGKTLSSYTDLTSLSSPVFVRKMTDKTTTMSNVSYSGTDIMEYRYAELLLNLAECYAATGDVPNCLKYIGQVRARVGIPSDNNYGLGNITDKNLAIAACLKERRIELAYEGKRFWDIKRWLLYDGGQSSDLALSATNTCTALGVQPLNGRNRKGCYLMCKTASTKTVDPLIKTRNSAFADVYGTSKTTPFNSQLQSLANFYSTYFELDNLDTPLDNVNSTEVTINWKARYYMWGFTASLLNQDSWFTQTEGWPDVSGSSGTFDYQDTNFISDSLNSTLTK